jgi:hypothetical protein
LIGTARCGFVGGGTLACVDELSMMIGGGDGSRTIGGADGERARVGGADGDLARIGAGIGGGAVTGLERAAGMGGGTEIGLDRDASAGGTCTRSGSGVPSTIARSRAVRSFDPGGGGGWVFGFLRVGAAGSGVGDPTGDDLASSTDHPEAKSAIRSLVSSPIRRRVRSSSGTFGR